MSQPKPYTPSHEESERRDAIASAFLAFAAMMKDDYGISKSAALLSLEAAYNVNEDRKEGQHEPE